MQRILNVVIVAGLFTLSTASGQKPNSLRRVDWQYVQSVCNHAQQVSAQARGRAVLQRVLAFCALTTSPDLYSSGWTGWEIQEVPSPADLDSVAFLGAPMAWLGVPPEFLTLSESPLLFGLADFVISRIKEDISALGLRTLAKRICREKIRPLLPNTCTVLKLSFDGEGILGLGTLQQAVREDVQQLPHNALGSLVAALRRVDDPKLRDRASFAFFVAYMGYSLRSSRDVLEGFASLTSKVDPRALGVRCDTTPTAAFVYQFSAYADVIRQDRFTMDSSPKWRSEVYQNGLKALLINARFSGRPWPTGGNCTAQNVFGSLLVSPARLYALIFKTDTALSALRTALAEVHKPAQGDGLDPQSAARRHAMGSFEAFFGLLATAIEADEASRRDSTLLPALLALRRSIVESADGQYGSAFVSLLESIRLIAPTGIEQSGALTDGLAFFALAADLAQAKDAETVSALLKQAAASRRSYLRKRGPWWQGYATLNAYGGGILGQERTSADADYTGFAAPFLPIGVEGGIALGRYASLGLFVQFLDLGPLGAYRLKSTNTVASTPNVGVRQVFSPGVSVLLGISRLPVTLGLLVRGASPGLRTVTTAGSQREAAVTRRWGGFVAFDVPIF